MPPLNRPLTPEELKAALNAKFPDNNELWNSLSEPKYQFVRYDALLNSAVYERADTFYFPQSGPSDCHWMVPCGLGALEC